MDGVDEQQRARRPRDVARPRQIVDRAEGVRCAADGEELRARPDQRGEMVVIDLPGLAIHARAADDHAALALQRAPWRDVAVMIELGDEHFVAGLPGSAEGAAEVEGERGHVRAEDNLLRRGVEESRARRARAGDDRVGLAAGRIRPVRVRVVVEEVVGHGVADDARHLRAAGGVEVGDGKAVVEAIESGKLVTDGDHRESSNGQRGMFNVECLMLNVEC